MFTNRIRNKTKNKGQMPSGAVTAYVRSKSRPISKRLITWYEVGKCGFNSQARGVR